jgi:hypothetical protein
MQTIISLAKLKNVDSPEAGSQRSLELRRTTDLQEFSAQT